MKRFTLLVMLSLLVLSCTKQQVCSPDESLQVSFRLTEDGAPQYCVTQDGATVLEWSQLGLVTADPDLTRGFKILRTHGAKTAEVRANM